jgi:hypothetical protein
MRKNVVFLYCIMLAVLVGFYRPSHLIISQSFITNYAIGITFILLHWLQTPWYLVSERPLDVFTSRRLADNFVRLFTLEASLEHFMSSLLGGQRITNYLASAKTGE